MAAMTATSSSHHVESLRGHCACGALRYTIELDHEQVSNSLALSAFCHCARCQRLNGAPYVWTSHWHYAAVTWSPAAPSPPPGIVEGEKGAFSPAMSTFETMKGRKWKLRCTTCGSPLGSWNAAKHKWTIWPSTLARRPAKSDGADGILADGQYDISDRTRQAITPTHHQFYGAWRSVVVRDGLDKWQGYANESQQLTDDGEPLQR